MLRHWITFMINEKFIFNSQTLSLGIRNCITLFIFTVFSSWFWWTATDSQKRWWWSVLLKLMIQTKYYLQLYLVILHAWMISIHMFTIPFEPGNYNQLNSASKLIISWFTWRCHRSVCLDRIRISDCWKNSADIYQLRVKCIKWNKRPLKEYHTLVSNGIGTVH